jgi:prolyl-tRNA synthetase
VATPGKRTIEEITAFLKVPAAGVVKTLIYTADGVPVAALVRGDHELNEAKLKALLKCDELAIAGDGAVTEATGAPVGFAGPSGLRVRIVADAAVRAMGGFVTGANEADAHLLNVHAGRDFEVSEWGDIRTAAEGDRCPKCDGTYRLLRGIEVGQVFYLGTKYSEKMKAVFLDEGGRERPVVMGCYGIGVGRTAAAAIEQNHDENGIIWPMPIAPFQAALLCLGVDQPEAREASDRAYAALLEAGVDVLYDDRQERAGVMFKDADLIGVPIRIGIGKKSLEKGGAEVRMRRGGGTEIVPLENLAWTVRAMIASEMDKCRP